MALVHLSLTNQPCANGSTFEQCSHDARLRTWGNEDFGYPVLQCPDCGFEFRLHAPGCYPACDQFMGLSRSEHRACLAFLIPHALDIGRPLPTMPLWLADDLAVPLELEESYEQSCAILNIP